MSPIDLSGGNFNLSPNAGSLTLSRACCCRWFWQWMTQSPWRKRAVGCLLSRLCPSLPSPLQGWRWGMLAWLALVEAGVWCPCTPSPNPSQMQMAQASCLLSALIRSAQPLTCLDIFWSSRHCREPEKGSLLLLDVSVQARASYPSTRSQGSSVH